MTFEMRNLVPIIPGDSESGLTEMPSTSPPLYSPSNSSYRPSTTSSGSQMQSVTTASSGVSRRHHTNPVIEASKVRARDEQETKTLFQNAQRSCRIYNPEIEPEHETTMLCDCAVHKYWERKLDRLDIQDTWSRAVIYPGEKPYHDCTRLRFKNHNPYSFKITSPFSLVNFPLTGMAKPDPHYHLEFIEQTRALDSTLNAAAEEAIQALEPAFNIWDLEQLESLVSNMSTNRRSSMGSDGGLDKTSKRSGFRKAFSMKSSDERTAIKMKKKFAGPSELRDEIIAEEQGRWQDSNDKQIVTTYQENIGIAQTVAELRKHQPVQYLHLLRGGYFEPIMTSWEGRIPNLLNFTIDAAAGWRGFTPTWRGYNTIAEERLYWVLGNRPRNQKYTKPALTTEIDKARTRMDTAVQPGHVYESVDDINLVLNGSPRYTDQVPMSLSGRKIPISPRDETMVLLETSSLMDTSPMRPEYTQYLITSHTKVNQPRSKETAKVAIRDFVNAMKNYDSNTQGYPLVTFSQSAEYIGYVHGWDVDELWREIRFTGKPRVMTGWQKIKELHFRKHSATATYHPNYGWQASPRTPRLRLLLVLCTEPSDIDEFELEILSLPWVYITIFLIGVEGCLNHHRFANRINRISEVNNRVSFVAAQGKVPGRFVTHQLLKRHLGSDLSMSRFQELELPMPAELPSQLQGRHSRTFSNSTDLDDLPVELPSPEETSVWQSENQSLSIRGLAELSGEREPAELPTTERWDFQHDRNPVTSNRISHREPPPPYLESV